MVALAALWLTPATVARADEHLPPKPQHGLTHPINTNTH